VKKLRYINGALDATDAAMLKALGRKGRFAVKDLAAHIGLSGPSTTERMRRLEESGIIKGYTVQIRPEAVGLKVGAYLRIKPLPGELKHVQEIIAALPAIVVCDRVTGDDCFIAKAYVPTMADLEALINHLLPYAATNTSVIVSTPVEERLPTTG
jgi:Lrp/AsnC family leucine-responsive transcriptional regulator